MYVKIFESEMEKININHLKNFYLLVPILTINFVKDLAISKEKL